MCIFLKCAIRASFFKLWKMCKNLQKFKETSTKYIKLFLNVFEVPNCVLLTEQPE